MTAGSDALLRYVRGLAARPDPDNTTDATLLGRFIAARDETAFAALVDRHGPLVFRVCRRVLGDVHEAVDAFQAVFLVLARKAATVHPREALCRGGCPSPGRSGLAEKFMPQVAALR
jgi:hypothetical protein